MQDKEELSKKIKDILFSKLDKKDSLSKIDKKYNEDMSFEEIEAQSKFIDESPISKGTYFQKKHL